MEAISFVSVFEHPSQLARSLWKQPKPLPVEAHVIPAENVLSEAYVLPTIEKVGDKFPDNIELADYFVVIPEQAKWMGIIMQLIDEFEEET